MRRKQRNPQLDYDSLATFTRPFHYEATATAFCSSNHHLHHEKMALIVSLFFRPLIRSDIIRNTF
jgi:hypothetical protein